MSPKVAGSFPGAQPLMEVPCMCVILVYSAHEPQYFRSLFRGSLGGGSSRPTGADHIFSQLQETGISRMGQAAVDQVACFIFLLAAVTCV